MAGNMTRDIRDTMMAEFRKAGTEFGFQLANGVKQVPLSPHESMSVDFVPKSGYVAFEIPDVVFKYANATRKKPVYVVVENGKDTNIAEPIMRYLANNVEYHAPDNSHFAYENVQNSSPKNHAPDMIWVYDGELANFTFFTNKGIFERVITQFFHHKGTKTQRPQKNAISCLLDLRASELLRMLEATRGQRSVSINIIMGFALANLRGTWRSSRLCGESLSKSAYYKFFRLG